MRFNIGNDILPHEYKGAVYNHECFGRLRFLRQFFAVVFLVFVGRTIQLGLQNNDIGKGGGQNAELAKRADKVVAIEIDERLIPVLEETLAEHDNVKVINADVMKVDLHKLIEDEFDGLEVAVCANLPYYITSPILMMLLEQRLRIRSVTVMVQKEAGARLCAPVGTRDMGAVTVAVNYFSEPKILFNVSRRISAIPSISTF